MLERLETPRNEMKSVLYRAASGTSGVIKQTDCVSYKFVSLLSDFQVLPVDCQLSLSHYCVTHM